MPGFSSFKSFHPSRLLVASLAVVSGLLSGCGTGSVFTTVTSAAGLQAVVEGGNHRIASAAIQVYAASTSGLGTAATPMLSLPLHSDPQGSFTLPALTCVHPTDQIYVVASGGNAGSGVNTGAALMSDLGACSGIASLGPISINENTTIASVYALAQFMNPKTFDVAAPGSQASVLASDYTAAGTLINQTTGVSLASSGVQSKLDSLSDSLSACVDSPSGSAACASLFADATPPATTAVPANTIAAILNIALNPTRSVIPIYQLASATPFQPALSSAPSDWRLFGTTSTPSSPSVPVVPPITANVPTVTWATPAAITYGTALSATQLDATASVAGSFAYTPAAGTVLAAGTQTLSVTFTPTSTSYTAVTKTVSLTVNTVAPTVTWAAPAAITYGTALSATQLDATASVAGSFVYTPAAGTVLAAGTQTLGVKFTPTSTDYTAVTKTVSLSVTGSTPTVTWATPAAITYGTALSATQLDATASVAGSFAYTPAVGAVLAAGTQTLSVTFTPTSSSYTAVTKTVSLSVTGSTPTVTWATPAAITYGTALSATQLDATASVAGSFAYTPAAGTVLAAGTQTLSVKFTPTSSSYTAVTKTVSLSVTGSTPTVTWATPAAITYGTALSATQLDATASVAGSFAYTPAAGTVLAAGTQTLSVKFTPTSSSYAAVTKTVSLSVTGSTPTVAWATPAAIIYGTALSATQLDATASVAGSFAYTPAAGTVLAAGTQTLSVTFTPTSTSYTAVTKTVSLSVTGSTPTVTWATPAAITYGTALSATQLDATASVAGSFAYTPAAGTVLAAGTQTLSVKFTPNSTSYTAVTKTVSLSVTGSTPTVTWATPAAITYGTALSATQLDATASVAGSFAYTPAAGAVLAAGTQTLSVTFTPTSGNYAAVTQTVSLTVKGTVNPSATNIEIGTTVAQSGLKRLGINIDGQNYYDSGQMLRNLTFGNSGFEAEMWQTILMCSAVTATSCTDQNQYSTWPANFVQGAQFSFIYGAANGQSGTVTSSTAASYSSNQGVTIHFGTLSPSPAVGDYVIVKMTVPGNGQAGWWPSTNGGATLTSETSDISPNSPGKQALSISASASGQSASVTSYFDSFAGRSFVQLNGTYQITFRAKGMGGNNQVSVSVQRSTSSGNENFFNQTVTLSNAWRDYSYTFTANETGSSIGTAGLSFAVSGANILLDDAAVTAAASSSNPTVFRNEVVNTLQALKPGSLRYMDGGGDFGSTIDNMLAVPLARQRAGSSTAQTVQDDIPIGLHEFLQLCQAVGAEPWFTMPPGMSATEMQNLIQYLAGPSSTTYGAIRTSLGQAAPWTSVFPVIHLELGNEQWNYGTFPGAAINDATAYGNRAATIFGAARSSPYYAAASFDLVMGSWAAVPWWTGQEASSSSNYDSIAVAPYLFNSLNDTSSNEAIFGPMFAQPESVDSVSSGYMYQQAQAAAAPGKNLVVYEVQLGTQSGSASQSAVNSAVPSVAAGLTVADHMLLMMRDLGVKTQQIWALPEYQNQFNNTNGGSETVPLFGAVVDMGGETNLRRPVFLAEQLANTAILPEMLATTLTGANPTWNQALSTNDSIQLANAHELQTFAFSDGSSNRSVVVFNLNRTTALPITFSGANAPAGTVTISQLTSKNLTDSNEASDVVNTTSTTLSNFQPATSYSLPPFSMTVFSWVQ